MAAIPFALLLVAAAVFTPSLSSLQQEQHAGLDGEALLMLGRFHGWMAAHGRSYATEEEKLHRFEVYRSNMEFIEAANRDRRMSYRLGETPFTDLTHDEFMAMYSSNPSSETTMVITTRAGPVHEGTTVDVEEPPPRRANLTAVVPASVDWRAKGVVTPPKFQGASCSSCWAFTTVATMESAHAISTDGPPPVLSEQQLVDCDTLNHGCSSGWMDKAFKWVIEKNKGGITTEEAYPYTGKKGKCQAAGKPVAVTLRDYKTVRPPGNEAGLMEAVAKQPVAASFDYSDPCFQHYLDGVYDAGCSMSGVYTKGACQTAQNHGLALVGYGTKPDGTKYWIGKNSWSEKWGDKGFIYLLRDSPPLGLCGIAALPVYPII